MLKPPSQLLSSLPPPLQPLPARPPVPFGIVGQLASPQALRDHLALSRPLLAPPEQLIPATSGLLSPTQQLMQLGAKYGVPFSPEIKRYQTEVIKAILTHKSSQYGVPLNVAMGIAGNESNWKMWTDIERGTVVQGKNIRDGVLKSTDWGAMQINDKAHPKAFPRARYDLEYNIDYGMKFLARRRESISGSLGLGFGDWDRTIASYNLGHDPHTASGYAIANRYVSHVKTKSQYA